MFLHIIATSFDLNVIWSAVQKTYLYWGFLVALWTAVLTLANRVADSKAKADRDKNMRDYQTDVDSKRKEAEQYEERRDKAKDGVVVELERKIKAYANITRELRRLLKDSMTYSDRRDKWVSVLEASALKNEPDLLKSAPQYTDHPSADDVASIYVEFGSIDNSVSP